MSPNSSTMSEAVNLVSGLKASIRKVKSRIAETGFSGEDTRKSVGIENVDYSNFPATYSSC